MEHWEPVIEGGSARRGDRLVDRYPTKGMHLTWSPPTQGFLRTRAKAVGAEVVELSVSGALLVAPPNPLVRRGTIVHIDHDGLEGTVEVRHLHDHPDEHKQCYGVLFLDLDPDLRDRWFRHLSNLRGDRERLHGHWVHAT